MVAVRFVAPIDAQPAQSDAIVEAVSKVERAASGLTRDLLCAKPSSLRALASAAREADSAFTARQAKVGEAPPRADADCAALAAWDELVRARREFAALGTERFRLLWWGNCFGVVALAFGGVLLVLGIEVMAPPVTAAVVAAATGPLLAFGVSLLRRLQASQAIQRAEAEWSGALRATGLETLGALRAREVQRNAWHRRVGEARAAREQAARCRESWHRLAGAHVPPESVDEVIARIERVRRAQIELVGVCLAQITANRALVDVGNGKFAGLVDKIRTRRLRLWTS